MSPKCLWKKKNIYRGNHVLYLPRQRVQTEGHENTFLEYELKFGQESSERQVKAFRFNLAATEAYQMFSGQEN